MGKGWEQVAEGGFLMNLKGSGFPGGSVVKNPPGNAGDAGLIPGLGRSPGGGNATHSTFLAWKIP